MCGICGASLATEERVSVEALAHNFLLGIEERGRHATGLAWHAGEDVWIDKAAVPATEFVRRMPEMSSARTFIGHTRWASQGSPDNPLNNHPIEAGGLVGIHNGVLSNDDDLFSLIGEGRRRGQVDSEAIFAFLAYSGMAVDDALQWMRGSAAVAWIDSDAPDVLHLARVSSSPLTVAISEAGSLLFASTQKCLERFEKLGGVIEQFVSLEEGTYLAVRHGEVVDSKSFATQGSCSLSATERKALHLEPQA